MIRFRISEPSPLVKFNESKEFSIVMAIYNTDEYLEEEIFMETYNFGKKIREIREKRGLTQEELGRLVDKSASTIYGYEVNQIEPPYETLCRLSTALNVEIEDILELKGVLLKDKEDYRRLMSTKWWEQKK